MKENYTATLEVGQEFVDFFIVKGIQIKTGSNGRDYLDITLGDKTGEVSAKKWNITESEVESFVRITEGCFVKIKALVKEWNGAKQLDISRIRKTTDTDPLEKSDYIKTAPEPTEEMFNYIYSTAESFDDEELKLLCTKVLEDNKQKLLYWPAASKNHHAEYGGLLYHTKRMMENGKGMCKVYKRVLNEDLVLAGVILHDMEKIREIDSDENGISSGYSFEGQMLGHIIQGVKSIDVYGQEIGMSEEKRLMLEHMILSHHYEPEFGSPKKPLFPEAEILHYLDIIDARMYDMEEALSLTERGKFTEKIWTLDNRKLYKSTSSKIEKTIED